jgi:hypothetical protein
MSVELRYDPIANPYAPGAGTPPPTLAGRTDVIERVDVSLQRLLAKRASQHTLLTGLRGVGKTVLLSKLSALGQARGYHVIRQESVGSDDTIRSILRQARRILDDLAHGPRVTRAIRSIDSVSLTLAGTGFRLDRAADATTRPDREALADAVVDLAAAAADDEVGIMLAIDEAQSIDRADLRRLLAGIHRCGQDQLPLACVMAGLPNLVGDVAKAATYAERMFSVANLGALAEADVIEAVRAPAEELAVTWSADALAEIVERSAGYPFFVQTWAFHTWNLAKDDPISADDVERARTAATSALDSGFFAARIARIPPSEVAYVRALASLGPGPHRSGDVAAAGGHTTSAVAAMRDRLITEGVVFAPRFGWVEFAIPHFDDYVRRELA